MTLQNAIDSLYNIAVAAEKSTSTARLNALADYCIAELARRGMRDARSEVTVPGGGRPKKWDVVWKLHHKPRLVISLKSILKNLGGTVPNRIDDLMGEVANVQMYSPEIVTGYLMIFNTAVDVPTAKRPERWAGFLAARLAELSGRGAPAWSIGTVEAAKVVEVDFTTGPALITAPPDVASFFDQLVEQVRERNPGFA